MKKFAMMLFVALAVSAFAADTTVKGTLVDMACAREDGAKADFPAKHNKGCLQMDECEKSGYGLMTPDKKVIRFDAAGNAAAKKFIAELTKKTDIRVSVTGTVNGDSMTVSKIDLQP
jgi:hypothetical protein